MQKRSVQLLPASTDELDGFDRQTSLLPGEIHTPQQCPTPVNDWTRGDSLMWVETKPSPLPRNGHPTPRDLPWPQGKGTTASAAAQEEDSPEKPTYDPDGSGRPLAASVALADMVAMPQRMEPQETGQTSALMQLSSSQFVTDTLHRQPTTGSVLLERVSTTETTTSSDFTKYRSQSEVLSMELIRQGRLFPPPPPPRVPMETRRPRAELWYYYASGWDLTHELPFPPQSPLHGLEEELRNHLQELTLVPYRGDGWLSRCEYWHEHVQQYFSYPPENQARITDIRHIVSNCAI